MLVPDQWTQEQVFCSLLILPLYSSSANASSALVCSGRRGESSSRIKLLSIMFKLGAHSVQWARKSLAHAIRIANAPAAYSSKRQLSLLKSFFNAAIIPKATFSASESDMILRAGAISAKATILRVLVREVGVALEEVMIVTR